MLSLPNTHALATLACSLVLVGCSAEALLDAEAQAPSAPEDSTLGSGSPALDTTTVDSALPPSESTPSFWSVSGTLDVSKGQVQLDTSTLEVGLWNDSAELLCSLPLPLLGVGQPILPKTEALLFQWTGLDHDAGLPDKGIDCPMWPAGSLELGIGLYDAALDPAMDAAGQLGADVYGFYVRPTTADPVYLVGIARTAGLKEGTDSTVEAPPLPDGAYEVDTLVLLSAPPLP
ncbi:MAG: hypothetical protein KTR31_03355 [Myxococcales bacterium]|nr:hypothetical protein [Myxococcales bacterium]